MIKDFPPELVTGIEKIDQQHTELLSGIKTLHESFISGNNSKKLLETFHYIKRYIKEHFETEENYMTELNYPHSEKHIKAHRDFTEDYSNLEILFKKDGLSPDFSLDFNIKLIEWLKNHVLDEDFKLADFIRSKNAVSS